MTFFNPTGYDLSFPAVFQLQSMPLSISEPFSLTFALDWLDMLDLDMHGRRRHLIVLDYCKGLAPFTYTVKL